MARPPSSRPAREALGFWLVTLIICGIAGLVSYQVGKNWVGKRLANAVSNQHIEIKPQVVGADSTEEPGEDSEIPPAEAQIEMEPRAPTEAERRDLTLQEAQASAAEPEPAELESVLVLPEEPSPTEVPEPETTGGFLVTAGSYRVAANAERVKADLEKQGYHPHLTQVETRGTVYNRVVVGVYGDRQEAEKIQNQLEAAGFVSGVMSR